MAERLIVYETIKQLTREIAVLRCRKFSKRIEQMSPVQCNIRLTEVPSYFILNLARPGLRLRKEQGVRDVTSIHKSVTKAKRAVNTIGLKTGAGFRILP
jgi:hypothetical protein